MTRKKLLLVGIGLAAAGVAVYLIKRKNYSSFFGLFKKKNPFPTKVLFVGDSITAESPYTYPTYIKSAYPNMLIERVAKPGMTTDWMRKNLPSKLNRSWDRIYIYGGVNDAFNTSVSQSTTLANIQAMVDLAKQNGAKPYVITGIEPVGYMDYKKMPTTRYIPQKEGFIPLIERYKQIQNAIPKSIKGATIVPKFKISGSMTSDGIHPSGSGQQIMAQKIIDTF